SNPGDRGPPKRASPAHPPADQRSRRPPAQFSRAPAATAATTSRFRSPGGRWSPSSRKPPEPEGARVMEMNSPVGRNVLDDSGEGVVGKPLDRVDGRLKVTGGAIYADEVQHAPQTAIGFLVPASIGRGRITSI